MSILDPREPSPEEFERFRELHALELRITTLEIAVRQAIKYLEAINPHDGESSQRLRWAKAMLIATLEGDK